MIDSDCECNVGAGTFWGELGFFRLERGKNALQIESGDCWCASSSRATSASVTCLPSVLGPCAATGTTGTADTNPSASLHRLAEPDFEMETAVREGEYEGSMVSHLLWML